MLNVLHLASFSGNIGDNANHLGFRPWFEAQLGMPVEWTNLEIREFYWHERDWDEDLVDHINGFDLLVVGGGNYFEMWVEHSPTGTSIGFGSEIFRCINIPVFFNALGADPGQGVPDLSRKRFASFLDTLNASDQYLVSLRNDGAMENLSKHVGSEYAEHIHQLPDHGFFVDEVLEPPVSKGDEDPTICINLAGDMPEIRFAGFHDPLGFAEETGDLINLLANSYPDHKFMFMPHIFRDFEVINQVLTVLPDRLRRTRVQVAEYGCGNAAAKAMLGHYATADLVLGMRFHANVCPMALSTPTIGLNCYIQIENLYGELNLESRVVFVSKPGFAEATFQLANELIAHKHNDAALTQSLCRVKQQRELFQPVLRAWLNDFL